MAYELDITLSGGNQPILAMVDASNYADEVGHTAADFDELYIIQVVDASGIELAVLSDIIGADLPILTPAEATPAPAVNSYTSLADQRYVVNTMAVPTYSAAVSYVYSSSEDVFVYHLGIIYELLQSGTGQTPASSPTYWDPIITVDITDVDSIIAELPDKYLNIDIGYISVDSEQLWIDMMYRAHTEQGLIGDDATSLMNNREWKDAATLYLDLRALPGDLTNLNYEAMDDIFTKAALLLVKYS